MIRLNSFDFKFQWQKLNTFYVKFSMRVSTSSSLFFWSALVFLFDHTPVFSADNKQKGKMIEREETAKDGCIKELNRLLDLPESERPQFFERILWLLDYKSVLHLPID